MKEQAGGIYVLAGTNGAGKSSVAGAHIRAAGADYFNPDEATQRILIANPGLSLAVANGEAWEHGRRLLERAINERGTLALETTLGGNTVTRLLESACAQGLAVRIWYVGLEDVGMHIARVRARVARGGHDIPEAKIRERYDRSRENLIRLLPGLAELMVHDNSDEGDPAAGVPPRPRLIVHAREQQLVQTCPVPQVPQWAKPIYAAAMRCIRGEDFRHEQAEGEKHGH